MQSLEQDCCDNVVWICFITDMIAASRVSENAEVRHKNPVNMAFLSIRVVPNTAEGDESTGITAYTSRL